MVWAKYILDIGTNLHSLSQPCFKIFVVVVVVDIAVISFSLHNSSQISVYFFFIIDTDHNLCPPLKFFYCHQKLNDHPIIQRLINFFTLFVIIKIFLKKKTNPLQPTKAYISCFLLLETKSY